VTCGDVAALCPDVTERACLQAVSILGDDERAEAMECFSATVTSEETCAAEFYGCTGRPEVLGVPGEVTVLTCPAEPPSGSCNRYMPECVYGEQRCRCVPIGPDLDAPANWACTNG